MITFLILSFVFHALVFIWAICQAAKNGDAAMEAALKSAREDERQ